MVVVVVVQTLLYDMNVSPLHANARAPNWVAGHLGVRLPATPPPNLRPNGRGQPWPCAWGQGLPTTVSELQAV